jgi:hypothetical protein
MWCICSHALQFGFSVFLPEISCLSMYHCYGFIGVVDCILFVYDLCAIVSSSPAGGEKKQYKHTLASGFTA